MREDSSLSDTGLNQSDSLPMIEHEEEDEDDGSSSKFTVKTPLIFFKEQQNRRISLTESFIK
jgi:hypothetical protein